MTGANSLAKTVTQQSRDCDLKQGPSVPESSTLTTQLPSHPSATTGHIYALLTKTERPSGWPRVRRVWRGPERHLGWRLCQSRCRWAMRQPPPPLTQSLACLPRRVLAPPLKSRQSTWQRVSSLLPSPVRPAPTSFYRPIPQQPKQQWGCHHPGPVLPGPRACSEHQNQGGHKVAE